MTLRHATQTWQAVPIAILLLACVGCTQKPSASLASPQGTYEVRVFRAGTGHSSYVDRIVILRSGEPIEEIHVGHAVLPPGGDRGPLAIADDGSLYIGRNSGGHIGRLMEVYVYRSGTVRSIGRAPWPDEMRGARLMDARCWQQWEERASRSTDTEYQGTAEPAVGP